MIEFTKITAISAPDAGMFDTLRLNPPVNLLNRLTNRVFINH